MIKFKCIAIDPPWPEQGGGKIKRGADRHYSLIKKKEQILEVICRAVSCIAFQGTQYAFYPDREGCHLWLWVTNNYLPWGLWLMEALGFTYKNMLTWVKASYVLKGDVPPLQIDVGPYMLERPGLGQYTMGQTEQLLFGTCGKAMKPKPVDRPRTAIMAPRPTDDTGKMIHSAKPPEAYKLIERVSPGPRLEMFARGLREGWTVWGDEVE
jgi:N6-adenosine-specific RNA methylase IME4